MKKKIWDFGVMLGTKLSCFQVGSKVNNFTNAIKINKLKNSLKEVGENFYIDQGFNFIGANNIRIGDNFSMGKFGKIQAWVTYGKSSYNPSIVIGNNVSIMEMCHISCINYIQIGDGCLLGTNVFITDNYHGQTDKSDCNLPPIRKELYTKGPVIICENVWIGRNVCVMPNVTIGEGAIIGANSVVTHDIPAFCVAAGTPARVIKSIKI